MCEFFYQPCVYVLSSNLDEDELGLKYDLVYYKLKDIADAKKSQTPEGRPKNKKKQKKSGRYLRKTRRSRKKNTRKISHSVYLAVLSIRGIQ